MCHSRLIRRLTAFSAAMMLLFSLCMLAQAEDPAPFVLKESPADAPVLTIREVASQCRTSVVAIETESRAVYNNDYYGNPFGMYGFGYGYGFGYPGGRQREYTQTGAGSGIILSEDGYILTNYHVISGADKIKIYVMPEDKDGEEAVYEATLIGSSESSDVAVLKIEATGLNAAVFGDSDQLEIGEPAIAIGNPMGKAHGSVTAGIISATEQELTIDDITISAIQTDAAINPGNSGGALFDEHGSVVGLVYAKSSSISIEGIGYAIPVNSIKTMVSDIINNPSSVQAQTIGGQIMLGITIVDVTEEMSRVYSMPVGVYVREVSEMSAAERAGLTKGDIIMEFAGQRVTCADDLNAIKAQQTPGDMVSMKVDRNGREVELTIRIPRPTEVETAE